jgi:hypothetical protein
MVGKLNEDGNSMWIEISYCIMSVAKEVLGEWRGISFLTAPTSLE